MDVPTRHFSFADMRVSTGNATWIGAEDYDETKSDIPAS